MTTNYDNLSAREIDARVAERVFGYRVEMIRLNCYPNPMVKCFINPHGLIDFSDDGKSQNAMMYRNRKDATDGIAEPLPAWSTDIAAAFLVVEKMRERGFVWSFNCRDALGLKRWYVKVDWPSDWIDSTDAILPRAIAVGALRAVEEDLERC